MRTEPEERRQADTSAPEDNALQSRPAQWDLSQSHDSAPKPDHRPTTTMADVPHEIEHQYLDFDTPLPYPVGILCPRDGQRDPPPAPNLAKYGSPFLWSESRKTVVTIISCGVTAMSAYAAGEYTPPANELMEKWHVGKVVYNLGITLFTLGFGIAPMVLAPFSEINGRRPIFVSSGLVFTGPFSSFFPHLESREDEVNVK